MPLYPASPAEIAWLVKMDGSFHIEKMELLNTQTRYEGGVHAQDIVIHLRAGLEGIISKHFGSKIVDEVACHKHTTENLRNDLHEPPPYSSPRN